tara:strand:- start:948 stop:1265 length:318 start_codon:yes stop_codon:yes gene_type:complete
MIVIFGITIMFVAEYTMFGIIDNTVMVIGALTGLEIEKFLPKRMQIGMGAVYGACVGNAVSDFMGGAVTGSWDLAFNTAWGCLLVIPAIPLFSYVGKLRRQWRSK